MFKMEAASGMNMFTNSEMVMSGLHFIGIDFICAALTLAYVARLVFHTVGASNVVAASCCVAKVSLRGQQIARRVR
jgi:hypothetical protein